MRVLKSLCLYSPLLLFAIVALYQHFLSNLSTLTRWKGAGMGMYSEPGPRTRSLLVSMQVQNDRNISFVLRQSHWPVENKNVRSFPTQSHLKQLMRRLTSVKWVYRDESRESIDPVERDANYPEELVIRPSLIRIEVRELVLELGTLSARLHTLSSYEERR